MQMTTSYRYYGILTNLVLQSRCRIVVEGKIVCKARVNLSALAFCGSSRLEIP